MMKRFLLSVYLYCAGLALLVLFVASSLVNGQVPELQNSDNYRLIRLLYTNSTGEEAVTDFEYDALGHLVFSRWRLLNGKKRSSNRYVLDANTQLIEKHRLFSDSIRSHQEFSYDLCGKLLQETYSRSDGIKGDVQYRYDDHGKLVGAECRNMNGWFTGNILYSYNLYGVMDRAIIRKEKEKVGEIEYQYDINGNLKLERWDLNGEWEQLFLYEYVKVPGIVYASPDPFIVNSGFYRVETEFYEYTNGGSGPSIYEYEEGKLVKKTYSRSDGLSTETAFKYDDGGILLNASRKYSDGKTADIFYAFDAQRRMIRKWFERTDGLVGEETYIYDSEGKLAMAEYRKVDAWLSGTIAFSHDKYGLPAKGYFKGDDNFDAEIYFYYDEYKNLIKVKWDFSYGKSQVYTFTYRAIYNEGSLISSILFQ
jgi:hypothetical protein